MYIALYVDWISIVLAVWCSHSHLHLYTLPVFFFISVISFPMNHPVFLFWHFLSQFEIFILLEIPSINRFSGLSLISIPFLRFVDHSVVDLTWKFLVDSFHCMNKRTKHWKCTLWPFSYTCTKRIWPGFFRSSAMIFLYFYLIVFHDFASVSTHWICFRHHFINVFSDRVCKVRNLGCRVEGKEGGGGVTEGRRWSGIEGDAVCYTDQNIYLRWRIISW